jgi:predicted TIM-barrel fold metal-dependent hydrolase
MPVTPFQLLALPKIDTHCHVLDPARFAYGAQIAYQPAGQEKGHLRALNSVMDFYNVRHALLVGPNSGYGLDNRCMLDAIEGAPQRFRGIAVIPNDCDDDALESLSHKGVMGLAFNASLLGTDYYADLGGLLARLAQRGMWAQFQVEGDQLCELMPMIDASGVRILVDHCGRPLLSAGLMQPGFQALLALGRAGRAVVKLSGFAKFSQAGYPFHDVRPYVEALAKNFACGHPTGPI